MAVWLPVLQVQLEVLPLQFDPSCNIALTVTQHTPWSVGTTNQLIYSSFLFDSASIPFPRGRCKAVFNHILHKNELPAPISYYPDLGGVALILLENLDSPIGGQKTRF